MNPSKEALGKAIGYIQAAAYSAFTSEYKSEKSKGFYPWEVIIRHIDDSGHPDNEFSLCSVCVGLVNRESLERCKFIVEHGLGFSSDIDLEAYQGSAVEGEKCHFTSGVSIPPKAEIGKSFCITVLWRLRPVYHVYTLISSDDAVLIKRDFKDFVVKLDRQLWSFGKEWLIGGALPDGYSSLNTNNDVAATFDGYSLTEKAS